MLYVLLSYHESITLHYYFPTVIRMILGWVIFLLKKMWHIQAILAETFCQTATLWQTFFFNRTWHTRVPATVWSKLLERVLKMKCMNKWIEHPIISKFSCMVEYYIDERALLFNVGKRIKKRVLVLGSSRIEQPTIVDNLTYNLLSSVYNEF